MPRYFAPITKWELKRKVEENFVDGDGELGMRFWIIKDKLGKDLKVDFDGENFEYRQDDDLMGIHALSNGIVFWGMSSCGDWQHNCFFIIYWDGKKLRGYVPTDGNPWNTDTNQAYGNSANAKTDLENIKKRFPAFKTIKSVEDFDGEWDSRLIMQDIIGRIRPQSGTEKKPKKKKSLQERIEALTFYGCGDEAYELFDQACNFCYHLHGLNYEKEALVVCGWAEEMAHFSRTWWEENMGGECADTAKGSWG